MNIAELRNKILAIHDPHEKLDFWAHQSQRLVYDLYIGNPEEFIAFPTIQQTMFVGNAEYTYIEYDELKRTKLFPFLKDSNKFVSQHQHPLNIETTGNTIHHMYHVYQYMQHLYLDFNDLDNVVEFGSGYGNMARIFNLLNPNIQYELIDMPELLLLQEYYLTNIDIDASNFTFHTHCQTPHIDLFIATWSLSEAPLSVREEYLHLNCDRFLLSMGGTFDGIDNLKWATQFITSYPDLKWIVYKNPLTPTSYYMFGG